MLRHPFFSCPTLVNLAILRRLHPCCSFRIPPTWWPYWGRYRRRHCFLGKHWGKRVMERREPNHPSAARLRRLVGLPSTRRKSPGIAAHAALKRVVILRYLVKKCVDANAPPHALHIDAFFDDDGGY